MVKISSLDNAYALIIGISNYKDQRIPKLNYTRADAEGFFKLLVDSKKVGLKKDNIRVLLDNDATLYNVKNAISDWLFKNADEDSIVFIYFAGHGGVEEDRLGIEKDNLAKYLLPFDSVFDNLFASALSNRDFNELLLSIKSKKLIIFMDSCYSGGVCERKARDVKLTEDPYQKIAAGEGRLVVAASQPNQRSFEDGALGHGIFTYHLIEALSGAADSDKDGYVTAIEAYKYLSDTVPKTAKRLAGGAQEPILRGDIKTDFVLSVNRGRLEEIDYENIKKKNLARLSEWYYDGKLSPVMYELARRLIKSNSKDLGEGDKKILKLLNDLLLDEISISTFEYEVEGIKGTTGLSKPMESEVKEERVQKYIKEEDDETKKWIDELSSHAQKLFGESNYAEAIDKWKTVLNIDPGNQIALKGIEKANNIIKSKEVKKKCPNCGAEAVEGDRFCEKCKKATSREEQRKRKPSIRNKLIIFAIIAVISILLFVYWTDRSKESEVPHLSVSLEPFSFDLGSMGEGETASRTFSISNTGGGVLNWNVSDDQPWIEVSPTNGNNSGEVIISINTTGLSQGSYSGTINIISNGEKKRGSISLDISATPTVIISTPVSTPVIPTATVPTEIATVIPTITPTVTPIITPTITPIITPIITPTITPIVTITTETSNPNITTNQGNENIGI